jgi:cobalt transporter subunit CbtB
MFHACPIDAQHGSLCLCIRIQSIALFVFLMPFRSANVIVSSRLPSWPGPLLKEEYHMSSMPGLLDNVNPQSRSSSVWKEKILPVLLAGGLGIVLIFGMGFAETSELHNAAHDGRHSAGFPCH